MKFHSNSLNSFQLTEIGGHNIAFTSVPRGIKTKKIYKQELWFLCKTHRLNVLYKCKKFHSNDQREITPKM